MISLLRERFSFRKTPSLEQEGDKLVVEVEALNIMIHNLQIERYKKLSRLSEITETLLSFNDNTERRG